MRKTYWLLLAIPLVLLGAWWSTQGRSSVAEIRFAKPRRETLISNLPTNGKAEPIEWTAVRVDAPGLVTKVAVRQGQTVARGALIAMISEPGASDQLRAAEARVAQARAELETLHKGGTSVSLTDLDNRISRTHFDRDQAAKEYGSLQRLAQKQAATLVEVEAARAKLQQLDMQIQSLEKNRAALVSTNDVAASEARLHEAEAGVEAGRSKLAQGVIRAPLAGTVYNLPARAGSYLNAGDLVASVGDTGRIRIRVYVDEPELGRVAVGQPVKITWDGLPGRNWMGTVERMPTEVMALGTRQVGEVICTIDNPGGVLVPGTNVDVNIETSVAENALTIPREALHRDGPAWNVFVLENGDAVKKRAVQIGASSVTRTEIKSGLTENDSVALPSDRALKDGQAVKVLAANGRE